MRFLAGAGPSIPDDLLVAREEGRVVSFVALESLVHARGLRILAWHGRWLEKLGATADDPVRKLIVEAQDLGARGMSSIIRR